MSYSLFYREQAAQQKSAADAATLDNVRDRCQRASDAWAILAERSERIHDARLQTASEKLFKASSENPDRELAAA